MRVIAFTLAAVAAMSGLAAAQSVEDQARAVFDAHKSAIVTVQIVVKMKFSGQEMENKQDITGTVISAEGLTVTSLAATDPSAMIKNMMPADSPRLSGFSSELSDVKILLEDGGEIPSQVVLRDAELDLAYIQPRAKVEKPMAFVDLAANAAPKLLDQIVAINRLGKVANRVHAVSLERVEAIVQKPRLFYIPGNDPTNSAQGSPAFTLDGKIVGSFVLRMIKGDGGRNPFGGGNDSMAPILLPAKDILDGAKQVPPIGAAPSDTKPAPEAAAPEAK